MKHSDNSAKVIKKKRNEMANLYSEKIGELFQFPNTSVDYAEKQEVIKAIGKAVDMLSSVLKAVRAVEKKKKALGF